jgi:putative flavoprotein involved in K+ transport
VAHTLGLPHLVHSGGVRRASRPAVPGPAKDDVADYLDRYARIFQLPIQLKTRVVRLERHPDGGFAVATTAGNFHAARVVVATGHLHVPFIPDLSIDLDPAVPQVHSADYRNPAQLERSHQILVVGAGNTGLQLAAELAEGRSVTVAAASRPLQLPQKILGRDVFHWLSAFRFFSRPAHARLSRILRHRELVFGSRRRSLQRRGIRFRSALVVLAGRTATFSDGTSMTIDAVLWATGYRPDYSWLDLAEVFADGQVRHDAGLTTIPGLYFLGLPWQRSRGSTLLGYVGGDAEALAARIATEVRAST